MSSRPNCRQRWMVVGRNRTPIITGMYSWENARMEAVELNATGLPEWGPYRVVSDEVAEDLDSEQ